LYNNRKTSNININLDCKIKRDTQTDMSWYT